MRNRVEMAIAILIPFSFLPPLQPSSHTFRFSVRLFSTSSSVDIRPFQKLIEAVPYRAKSKALDDYQLGALNPTFAFFLPEKKGLHVSQRRLKSPTGDIVLMGLEVTAPCDHQSCAFQTWCNETGICGHDYCLTQQVCKLPRLRSGAHCRHSDCPSLLRCQRSNMSVPAT
ncbi:hypothetical protein B0O80DRAFT_43156 [Mortierella sp. GBAus27b]|nr:hypothetical protein B0O80DRAFT_43156 [Mortierella sp. GBAus27b]